MSWVAVAIGGAALVNGIMQSNAAGSAAQAQTNAANQANATQLQMYNQTRTDQLPWLNRGNAAGNQLAYLMGLPGYGAYTNQPAIGMNPEGRVARPNGTASAPYQMNTRNKFNIEAWTPKGQYSPEGGIAQQMSMGDQFGLGSTFGGGGAGPAYDYDPTTGGWSPMPQTGDPNTQYNTQMGAYGSLSTPFSQTNWQADPGYAFRLAEGQRALERSGAARGMSLSGAQQRALLAYGQGMGSQEYGAAYGRYTNDQTNLFNRLSAISGTGQTAAGNLQTSGANYANQVGQNQLGAGNAAAAGYVGSANAWGNALNTGANLWNNYNAWNQFNQPSSWSYSGMGG